MYTVARGRSPAALGGVGTVSKIPVLSDKTRSGKGLTLSSTLLLQSNRRSLVVPRLSFLTTCSDDMKPCMILKALDESYKNHIGFAIIQQLGEEH